MSSPISYFALILLSVSFFETMSLLNLELTNCLNQWASESRATSTDPPVSASKSGIAGADTECPFFFFFWTFRGPNIWPQSHLLSTFNNTSSVSAFIQTH